MESVVDELEKLAKLKEAGALTEQEFEAQKASLLAQKSNQEKQFQDILKNDIVQNYIQCWHKSFQYAGRATRSEFWYFVLINAIISFVLNLLPLLGSLYSVAAIFPSSAVYVRRYHDIGKSAWFAFIPYLSLPVMILSVIKIAAFQGASNAGSAFSGVFMVIAFIAVFAMMIVWSFVFTSFASQSGENKYGKSQSIVIR